MMPVVGYTIGVVEGAVALELEAATTEQQLKALTGDRVAYVLTPRAAIELGQALIERENWPISPTRGRTRSASADCSHQGG